MKTSSPAAAVKPATRCVFAAYLAAGLLGVALLALAAGEGQLRLVACAALGGIAATLLRLALHASGEWHECVAEEDWPEETAPASAIRQPMGVSPAAPPNRERAPAIVRYRHPSSAQRSRQ